MKQWLGLNWPINLTTGWGVLGLNLALQAELDGRFSAVPLAPTGDLDLFSDEQKLTLDKVFLREKAAFEMLRRNLEGCFLCGFPVVQGLGNRLAYITPGGAERVKGSTNFAIAFFEDSHLGDGAVERSKHFDLILAGSKWNERVLRRNGIANVEAWWQGVDLSIFKPTRRLQGPKPRFLVFSGGKLEYRKGQDIVVAAFREFHKRHADAVLVTAWQNPLPTTMTTIHAGGHVRGFPPVDPQGRADVVGWLEANGIPQGACQDVGRLPNRRMSEVYAQADVAVFPNRCEGGTNLVAMECMACAAPTILSANTGHLDLLDEKHCYPLLKQTASAPVTPVRGTEGWGESDVAEIVEVLERVYTNRQEANERGKAAARFMEDWSWTKRFGAFMQHLRAIL
ncbi:MAG: glycosyltransferase family 4 protein [Verrucomicrobia bacterium]|nr:glycosyltransferase family 4 protein [Verrucomicrobiota bacterium]